MVNKNKDVDRKVYEDLTTKQKKILRSASGCDKSNTEIGREAKVSLAYVSEVLRKYGYMLPISEESKEVATDGGVDKNESENKNNVSVKVIVNCDCGESHEVSIDY